MYDVIILGSGPAGLTAAIYTVRAALKTLIIAGQKWGGQLMLTTVVENYPGFPEGIMGPELMQKMRKQAERLGAQVVEDDFVRADFSGYPFAVSTANKTYQAKSVIISTGAETRWLGVPREKELIGHGVSSCAPCDAFFFKGKKVIVVGGGDSAMDEALVLTKFASEVTLIHRRDKFRASKIMQERVFAQKKIRIIWESMVTEILGQEKVNGLKIKNLKTGEVTKLTVDGVFVAIGLDPNTQVLKGVELDQKGYVVTHNHTKTNVPGVFVAGDVHDFHYKQAVTAAGFGCMAALDAAKWFEEQKWNGF